MKKITIKLNDPLYITELNDVTPLSFIYEIDAAFNHDIFSEIVASAEQWHRIQRIRRNISTRGNSRKRIKYCLKHQVKSGHFPIFVFCGDDIALSPFLMI
jgi:hypothetical protein